jgi:hypothetical protein
MSTLKATFIQHPSSDEPNIILNADGTITASALSQEDTIAFIIALGG